MKLQGRVFKSGIEKMTEKLLYIMSEAITTHMYSDFRVYTEKNSQTCLLHEFKCNKRFLLFLPCTQKDVEHIKMQQSVRE